MVVNKLIVGLVILLAIYLLYKLLFTKSEVEQEFETLYNKVLTSDEYKVKSQHEK